MLFRSTSEIACRATRCMAVLLLFSVFNPFSFSVSFSGEVSAFSIAAADQPAVSGRQSRKAAAAAKVEIDRSNSAAAAPPPAELVVPPLTADELSRRFYQGINQGISGNGVLSTAEFVSVRDQLNELGYAGAPEFSRRLIEAAITHLSNGDSDGAASLFNAAVMLSPEDPQVNLAAASFPGTVGIGKSVELFLAGISAVFRDPIAGAKLLVNTVLITLIALTLSLAVTLVIQIARNGELLHISLGRKLPIRTRGFLTPILLVLLITLPLKLGILGALGIWSLTVAYLLPNRRWLGVASGLLILSWGLAIEHIASVSYNVSSPTGKLIGNLSANRFENGNDQEFLSILPNLSDQYVASMLGGIVELRGRRSHEAEMYLVSARARAKSDREKLAALNNLAAVLYDEKRYSEAKATLEQAQQLGIESFEVYYNLANTSIALLDVEAHRRYLDLAAKVDRSRAYAAEQLDTDHRPAITILPPWFSVFRAMFVPVRLNDRAEAVVVEASRQSLLGTMLPIRRSWAVAVFGALIVLIVAMLRRTAEMSRPLRAGPADRPSRIWAVFPAGRALAGESPLFGAVILAFVIGLVLAHLSLPIRLFALRSGDLAPFGGFVWAAAAIWCGSSFIGLSGKTSEPASGGQGQ